MSCRDHFWTVIFVLCSCSPLLQRDSDFERGLRQYQEKQYAAAAEHFESYHRQHSDHDSTLYYLFDCYKKLDKPEEQMIILERLVDQNTLDVNVYLNLVYAYRKYGRYRELYPLLTHSPEALQEKSEKHLAFTRLFLAEIICGASRQEVTTDPLIYSISKGFLPLFPDGQLYADDTLTNANLIVLLDRLLEPEYPRNFFPMKNISTRSYLYLPYMRLVASDILMFEPYLNPASPARIFVAVRAIEAIRQRGRFD
jgi:tetratricopeptide (TPR) repeat protein